MFKRFGQEELAGGWDGDEEELPQSVPHSPHHVTEELGASRARSPGTRVTQYKLARWKSQTVQVRQVEESNSTSSPGGRVKQYTFARWKCHTVQAHQVEESDSISSPGGRVKQYKFARWKCPTVQAYQVEESDSTRSPGRKVRQYKFSRKKFARKKSQTVQRPIYLILKSLH